MPNYHKGTKDMMVESEEEDKGARIWVYSQIKGIDQQGRAVDSIDMMHFTKDGLVLMVRICRG